MAREIINVGTASDDGTGEPLRTGGIKINNNFEELYLVDATQQALIDSNSTTINTNSADITAIESVNTAQQTAIDSNSADITAIESVNTAQQTAIDSNSADITAIESVNTAQQTAIDNLIVANLERGYLNFVSDSASFVLVGVNVSKITNIRVSLVGSGLALSGSWFDNESLFVSSNRLTVSFKGLLISLADEGVYEIAYTSVDAPGVWYSLKNEFGVALTFNLYYNRSNFNIDYSLNKEVLRFELLQDAGAFVDASWEQLLVENKKYLLKIDKSSVLNSLLLNPAVKFYDDNLLLNVGKKFFKGQDYLLVKTVVSGSVVYDLKNLNNFNSKDFLPFHVLSSSNNTGLFLGASGISDYLTTSGRFSIIYDSVISLINRSYARGVGVSVLEGIYLNKFRLSAGYIRFLGVGSSPSIRLLVWANKVDDNVGVNSSNNGFVIFDKMLGLNVVNGDTKQFVEEGDFDSVYIPSGYYISYVISQIDFYGPIYNGRLTLK